MINKIKLWSRAVPRPILMVLLAAIMLLAASLGAGAAGCAPKHDNGTNNGSALEPEQEGSPDEAPRIDSRAPRFKLMDLNGELTSLNDYSGKAVIINFWTTWCPYCVDELPLLQELHESEEEVVVLAINVRENRDDVEAFIRSEGYTFPVLLDERAQVSGAYQVRGLPTTFAVNGAGIITAIRVGAFDTAGLAAMVESTR